MTAPTSTSLSFLNLTYRPDLGLLFVRWNRAVSTPEHQQGYEHALQLAQNEQAGRWLLDLRMRGLASVDDFTWTIREFLPRLQHELTTKQQRLAYLVTPNHYPTIQARLMVLAPTLPDELQTSATELRVFMEEQQAVEWLQAQ